MFHITRKARFEYAHRLMNHPGPCKNIHGHSGEAIVTFKSEQLDANNMVMDFSELKGAMNTIISKWDHAVLLNCEDKTFIEFFFNQDVKILLFDGEPTAEMMAIELYDELDNKFPGMVESVTISETSNNHATYTGE